MIQPNKPSRTRHKAVASGAANHPEFFFRIFSLTPNHFSKTNP